MLDAIGVSFVIIGIFIVFPVVLSRIVSAIVAWQSMSEVRPMLLAPEALVSVSFWLAADRVPSVRLLFPGVVVGCHVRATGPR